jgi:DNA repair exonuclease SbcCD ATPase subunit
MAEDRSVQQMQAQGARLIQNTPGLAEKLAASGKVSNKAAAGRDDRDTIIQDLQKQLDSEKSKNQSLEDQFKYRLAHFVKRETQTKNKIESLERRLNDGVDHDEHLQRRAVIENMHKTVIMGLESIQANTAKILQDQEKDLMRAFRARLQEVSKDLEATRKGKGEAGTDLQMRHKRVVAELHESQELAQTFDKKNQQLTAENQKLLEKLRTREDDRQCLLRELVLSKKENARLKAQVKDGGAASASAPGAEQLQAGKTTEDPSRKHFTQKQIEQARLQQTTNKQYEREVRFREAITKLKRMVEAERKTIRSLKQQQADMLQQRTEIEVLLRQCMDDVKAEIMRHRLEHDRTDSAGPSGPGVPITAMSVHELTTQDRERVLELLLSQQRVVQLLYSKTFPQQPPSPVVEEVPISATPLKPGGKEDDFSWLSDIIPPDA